MAKKKAARSSKGATSKAAPRARKAARKAAAARRPLKKTAKKSSRAKARPAAKTVATRKAAKKKAAPKKAAPKKLAAKRPAAKKALPKQAAAKRAPVKAKAPVKAAAPKKAPMKKVAPPAPVAKAAPKAVAAKPAAPPTPVKKPNLDRPRKTVADIHGVPSSLDLGQQASAARTGRAELEQKLQQHTSTSPALTAGDVDADWGAAEAVGDEAPGGDNPTPDQDVVDEIGRALGVEYDDDEELQGGDEIAQRDRHRWELDPGSSDDFEDR